MEEVRGTRFYDSWLQTERMLKRTRDLTMAVTLPRLRCLDQPSDQQLILSESSPEKS